MNASRREVLVGMVSLLAAPAFALEGGAPTDLVAHVRSVVLGFDLGEVVASAAEMVGLPPRHIRAWRAAVGDRFVGQGVRALDVLEADADLAARVDAVFEDLWGSLAVKLRIRRLIRSLDARPEAVQPLVDQWAQALLGLDVPGLRAHRAALGREGLLVLYGGATSTMDLGALLGSDLMTLFLEAVHGRRAEVLTTADPIDAVLHRLLDPEVRVVCFVGHGEWNLFSLAGVSGTPQAAWSAIVSALQSDLRGTVAALSSGRIDKVMRYRRGALREPALASWMAQWFREEEDRNAAKKDLVIRYTCGSSRFQGNSELVWALLPEALAARTHVGKWRAIGPSSPDDETWEQDFAAFHAQHAIELTAHVPFGTSLVQDPHNTRGYPGLSWIDDFVETPLPPWRPDPAFVSPSDTED